MTKVLVKGPGLVFPGEIAADAPVGGAGTAAGKAFLARIDGEVRMGRCRNTPSAAHIPEVTA